MVSQFDAAFDAIAVPMIEGFFGVVVSFTRGTDTTSGIIALVDIVTYEMDEQGGVRESANFRDYTLPVATTQISGVAVMPRVGDVISETIAGVVTKFEVLPVHGNDAVNLNLAGTRWLVHTKQVG